MKSTHPLAATTLVVFIACGELGTEPLERAAPPVEPSGPTLIDTASPALRVAATHWSIHKCLFRANCRLVYDDDNNIPRTPFPTDAWLHVQSGWIFGEPGSPGLPGEGLNPYQLRVILTPTPSLGPPSPPPEPAPGPCVTEIAMELGAIAPLDYDDDGALEDIYFDPSGIGQIAVQAAVRQGNEVIFVFDDGLCPDQMRDGTVGTFYFGFASPAGRARITARVLDENGEIYTFRVRSARP